MIVEQTQKVNSEEEAEDTLAGWRELPTFMVAYVKNTSTRDDVTDTYEVVGLFSCSTGKVQRGQRRVKQIEMKGGWVAK